MALPQPKLEKGKMQKNNTVVYKMLKEFVTKVGIVKVAYQMNYSKTYLWMLLSGTRPITDRVAEYFGYKQVTRWVPLYPEKKRE